MSELARVAVVVPAYREERHIDRTLRGIPPWVDLIVVVDDASPDATSAVVKAVRDERIVLVRHESNRGVGAAIYSGYQTALAQGADVLVVMAGDDQMDSRDLPVLIEPLRAGEADYVKGNRLLHPEAKRMPAHRRWGSRLLAAATSRVMRQRVGDSQCGYTALARHAAEHLDWSQLWPRYGYPNELLIALSRQGARIVEVPVRPVYRDEQSGLRPWHLISILWLIARRGRRRSGAAIAGPGQRLVSGSNSQRMA